MILLALTPVLIGLALTRFSGHLARLLTPALAVRLLTALALTVALCTGLVLSLAAVLVGAQLRPLATLGHWSAPVLRTDSGIPTAVGATAFLIVIACATAAVHRAARSVTTLWRAEHASRLFQPLTGDLVIIDDDAPTAYTVGAIHGRIIVSTAMLNALTPDERRVLLAHEAAHLRHRHHLYLHLAHLAAAANPLLRPTAHTVAYAIERWADEAAATEVGNRHLAATSLARAALAGAGHHHHPGALAAADSHITARVHALLDPPRRGSTRPVATLVTTAGVLCWTVAAVLTVWGNGLVQIAETAYLRH